MSRRRTHRMLGILTALCLCVSLAQAEEKSSLLPIVSGSDGSRVWVEVSYTGNRAKAVPIMEIPEKTIRQMATVGETGTRLLAPPAVDDGISRPEGTDVGKFLERHKSLAVREGPEGVSLGNAFDLVGNIREAVRNNRGNREKLEAIADTLKRASAAREPLAGTSGPGIRSAINLAAESGISPTGRVRPRIEIP
ncbi:MAG TPA: hypothetical protein VJ307_10345 [Candidatus Deferrimicrobiaceae bacterium]|nr:hypothetical protein [Candidatus Deferrimicrobiaceae bacterium]